MSELSRQVRIESQKRALVADNLHGQESVLTFNFIANKY